MKGLDKQTKEIIKDATLEICNEVDSEHAEFNEFPILFPNVQDILKKYFAQAVQEAISDYQQSLLEGIDGMRGHGIGFSKDYEQALDDVEKLLK